MKVAQKLAKKVLRRIRRDGANVLVAIIMVPCFFELEVIKYLHVAIVMVTSYSLRMHEKVISEGYLASVGQIIVTSFHSFVSPLWR